MWRKTGKCGTQLFSFHSSNLTIDPFVHRDNHGLWLSNFSLGESKYSVWRRNRKSKALSVHGIIQVCFQHGSVPLASLHSCLFTIVGWVDLVIIEVKLSANVDTIWSKCWKHLLKAMPYVCYTVLEKSRCFILG